MTAPEPDGVPSSARTSPEAGVEAEREAVLNAFGTTDDEGGTTPPDHSQAAPSPDEGSQQDRPD